MPIASNPETGEVLSLGSDGQWAPAKVAVNPETKEKLAFDGQGWVPVAASKASAAPASGMDTALDIAKSGGTGVAKGVLGMAGLAGDVRELTASGVNAASKALGYELPTDKVSAALKFVPLPGAGVPTSGQMQSSIENVTGAFHKPETSAGGYAQTAGEFLPAALMGPGGIGRRLLMQAAIPAISSEAAGQYVKESAPELEPYARVAGAMAGPAGMKGAGYLAAPISSRVAPGWFADQKMAQAFSRAGQTPEAVSRELAAASAEGQPMYTVADALGNSGQRLLSGVTRQPHEARQAVVEALDARQAGQGRRLTNTLSEGFAAPDTAAKRRSVLTDARTSDADVNYGRARGSAGAVDVSPAIAKADEFLTPGVTKMLPETQIADDSIEAVVRKARSYLTDGKSQISDFDAAFRAKREIDNLIEGASKTQQRMLVPIQKALDQQLAKSSAPYAQARDTFSKQSKAIDAIDDGAEAAMRGRTEDTIPAFSKMTPDRQAAFRSGYSDPLISKIQGGRIGTNKAADFLSDAFQAEGPAFAQPGQAPRMMNRIARENRMFETRAAATGGSRTADNLADNADVTKLGVDAVRSVIAGNFSHAIARIMSEASGTTPRVAERVARALMESDPSTAAQIGLRASRHHGSNSLVARQLLRGAAGRQSAD